MQPDSHAKRGNFDGEKGPAQNMHAVARAYLEVDLRKVIQQETVLV